MGRSRLFVVGAAVLVVLLIVGLLGLGGVWVLRMFRGQAQATPVTTATPTRFPTSTPTSTSIASPTIAATSVVSAPSPTKAALTPTATPSKGGVPKTGLGPMQVVLGGLALGTLMILARLLRLRGRSI
jgi:hypothetical protein